MKTKKGAININGAVEYMIGIMLLLVLALTWFFPTINGATGFNNTTTLWVAGTNYTWFAGAVTIMIIAAFLLLIWHSRQ